jgi:DNA invertase Pin-like site-specific DNA recombinase
LNEPLRNSTGFTPRFDPHFSPPEVPVKRSKKTPVGDPLKVVGYVRVSTEDQRLSPGAQVEALEVWCATRKAELLAVHEDLGVSGATPLEGRPGLQAALDAVLEHGAGVLLVVRRDRLARDVMVNAMVERLAQRAGAQVLSTDGAGNGEGAEQELMRCLVAAFAQYERALISTRTKVALGQKKKRGEKLGGALPYGQRLAADGVHLEVDPAEAPLVARAKELRAEGLTFKAIADRLADEGHRPRSGRWHPMTVARIVAA